MYNDDKQEEYLNKLDTLGFDISKIKDRISQNNKVNIVCKNGHSYSSRYGAILRSYGCKECYKLKPYYEIKDLLEKEGYIIVNRPEDFNGSANSKMEFKCKNNHIMISKCSHIRRGHRCKYCKYDEMSNARRSSEESIKKIIESINYEFLGFIGKYTNSKSKIYIKCDNNHTYITSVNTVKNGSKCNECYLINNRGHNSNSWKGGKRTLYHYLRSVIKDWRDDSFSKVKYTCFITRDNIGGNLVVHHHYNFYKIIDEVISELNLPILENIGDYTDSEILSMTQLIIKKHYEYGLGVVMVKDIHILFHSIYGNKNNNMEQVLEFKQDYLNGKYDDVLPENLKSTTTQSTKNK